MLCLKSRMGGVQLAGSMTIPYKRCKLSETLWGTRCMWLVGLSRCCSLRLGWFWELPWNERLGMLSCKLFRQHRSQLLWPGSKAAGSFSDLAAQRKVKWICWQNIQASDCDTSVHYLWSVAESLNSVVLVRVKPNCLGLAHFRGLRHFVGRRPLGRTKRYMYIYICLYIEIHMYIRIYIYIYICNVM